MKIDDLRHEFDFEMLIVGSGALAFGVVFARLAVALFCRMLSVRLRLRWLTGRLSTRCGWMAPSRVVLSIRSRCSIVWRWCIVKDRRGHVTGLVRKPPGEGVAEFYVGCGAEDRRARSYGSVQLEWKVEVIQRDGRSMRHRSLASAELGSIFSLFRGCLERGRCAKGGIRRLESASGC